MGKFVDKIIWKDNAPKFKIGDLVTDTSDYHLPYISTIIKIIKTKVTKKEIESQENMAKDGRLGCVTCKRSGVTVDMPLNYYKYMLEDGRTTTESYLEKGTEAVNKKIKSLNKTIEGYEEQLSGIKEKLGIYEY